MQDFLEIFKHSFHKCTLQGVRFIRKKVSEDNREFFQFVGKFELEPPAQIFESDIEDRREEILEKFKALDDTSSNCFSRKFTKKFLSGKGVVKKVDFQYVFDVNPKTIIDFELEPENNKMYLYVLGFGKF